jgi:hypothetical protein
MKPSEMLEEVAKLRSRPKRSLLIIAIAAFFFGAAGLAWTGATKITETVAVSKAQGWMTASSSNGTHQWSPALVPLLSVADGGRRNAYSGDWCTVDVNVDGDRALGFCHSDVDSCVEKIHEMRQFFERPPEQKCQVIPPDTVLYCATVTSGPSYWPDGTYFAHNDGTTVCYFEPKACDKKHVCSQTTKAALSM